jgi:DNA processing protein
MDEREAHIACNLLPGIGPVRMRTLVAHLGSPQVILGARADTLARVAGIGPQLAEQIATWQEHIDLGAELRNIRERDIDVIIPSDALYPRLLHQIHDAPLVLYAWGNLKPEDHRAIALVGSRRASHYGIRTARMLGFQLSQAGLTVISGLARGIDTAAHEGALAAGGRTIAVIGSGLGKLFPAENQGLAERIADGNGAVISEFPIHFPPSRQSFPRRNRIVSGWSSGVVVVEAAGRSGALITAEQAGEQGRSVYAVPGPIDRPGSLGCNRLIQDGARLILSAADVLDDVGPELRETLPAGPQECRQPTARPAPADLPRLTPEEQSVLAALAPGEEILLDQVASHTNLPTSVLLTTLMQLEIKRLVRQLPGQRYLRA